MKYCSKCGEKNPDEAKFCAKCGTPFVVEEKASTKPESTRSKAKAKKGDTTPSQSSTKTLLIVFVIIIIAVIAIVAIVNSNSSSSYSPTSNQSSNRSTSGLYNDNSNDVVIHDNAIDRSKVERVITRICRCSSKGGDYSSLRNCFTYEISPHPSGEIRYNNTIGENTRNYVERFEEYTVSNPYNIYIANSSFPLIVKCEVYVTWSKNGKRKRAWIDKTYYVTSDYKVSGFTDKETRRETLNY